MQPSPATRQLEAEANDTFCAYREQYFGVGTSSAYLWDLEDGFAGCFLIKKGFPTITLEKGSQTGRRRAAFLRLVAWRRCGTDAQHAKKATLSSGVWDSIHVVEVRLLDARAPPPPPPRAPFGSIQLPLHKRAVVGHGHTLPMLAM